uniref:Uncharacterized protein n=1 Tax=Panagrellus redivivus TaxID=6233 RepID=A0A7E4USQ2_PANRE
MNATTTRQALTLDVKDDTKNKVITVTLIVVFSVLGAFACLSLALYCIVKREKRRRRRKRKRARRPKMMRTPPGNAAAAHTASTATNVPDQAQKQRDSGPGRRKRTALKKLYVFVVGESTSESESNHSKHSEIYTNQKPTLKTEKEHVVMDIAPPISAEPIAGGDKKADADKERTTTPASTPKATGTPAKSPMIEETDATITPALEQSKAAKKGGKILPESGKSHKSTPAPSTGAIPSSQPQNTPTPATTLDQPESLKSTQSLTNLSLTKTSMSCKPRKHPPKDERFPKLQPGTVEYMAALCGEPPTKRDRYSGTMDGSDIVDLVNV